MAGKTTEWVERPWGRYLTVYHTPHIWTKTLIIREGARLSLQKHARREEFWHDPEGRLFATIGDETFRMRSDTVYHVPFNTLHRLENISRYELTLVEVAYGDPDESDIVRIADDYGRENT